jgi:hypothetical protein
MISEYEKLTMRTLRKAKRGQIKAGITPKKWTFSEQGFIDLQQDPQCEYVLEDDCSFSLLGLPYDIIDMQPPFSLTGTREV